MAINISTNSTEPNNLNKDNYKANQIPATQGNVIETLNTYNDELKKKYYDKEQTRADENALQKSIMTLVKLLDNNNKFTEKTKKPSITVDETTDDNYRLESYEGDEGKLPVCQDSQSDKNFIGSGLIQRINIISHLLSGTANTDNISWGANTHGNNVGVNEHTNCVPVIGYTREGSDYHANITKQSNDGHFKVNIEGLNNNNGTDLSEQTVLSEKQVADMISQSVYNVLGQYDSRITGILAYLIYHAGELPKSYEYVLGNYYTNEIEKAPLYITYESEGENGNRWSVHDLNGENEFGIGTETEDFWYEKKSEKTENGDITFSKSENVSKWQIQIPKLEEGKVLEHVDVYYDGSLNSAYSIPLPKKTFTLNLGLEESTNLIQYKCQFGGVEYPGSFNFNGGVGHVNVPQGSTIIVTLPDGFDGDLFYKYQYGKTTQSKIEISEDSKTFTINMENDQEVFAKVLTYTLKNGENTVGPSKKYYKTGAGDQADVTFEVDVQSQSKQGYNFTGTTLGGTKDGDKITISLSDIQRNNSYSGITSGEIIDTIKWEPKKFDNVTVHYVLDRNNISNIPQEWPTKNISLVVGNPIEIILDKETNSNCYNGDECGYDFVGLYDSTNLSQPPITECPKVDELKDLYAVYEIKKYNYNLVLNDGTLINVSTTGTNEWKLETQLVEIPIPERTGYTFKEWYTDINFGGMYTGKYLNQDATYYAKWEENEYKIKFELKNDSIKDWDIYPYFKYKEITVRASNMPFTLGEPYAEGYTFNGWKIPDSENEIKTINVKNFSESIDSSQNNIPTITLYASWKAGTVPVKEEYYYEIEGSNDNYDLVGVTDYNGTVNETYNCKDYTPTTGFYEENTNNNFKVKVKDNVYKRYFKRNAVTVTYHEEKNVNNQSTNVWNHENYKYSDNAIDLYEPNVKEIGNYTFDCWVDTNGKKVTCIPAYTADNVNYYAKYNQSAPVQDVDFEIERTRDDSNDTLTIRKKGTRTEKLWYMYKNDEPKEIETTNGITLNHNDIYDDSLKETKYALIYFGSEQESPGKRIIVNESSKVEVPLKFGSSDIKDSDYKQDKSAGTLEKTCTYILEYRFQNDEGNDGEWYELNKPLHVEKEDTNEKIVKLRRKETFDRICSEAVDVTFGTKQNQATPTNDDNQNIIVKREVSIYQPGQIQVKNGAFGNNNGPLQYRIFEKGDNQPTGSAWLNVERPTNDEITSVYINVDKECTVYFRYGENAQYLASEPISVDVETVMHNVTFHLEEFPSKSDGYDSSFPNRNADGSFIIKVKSGSQLYKCDEYINKVKEWEIFGYTPYTENLVKTLNGESQIENVPSSDKTVGGLQDSDRVLKFLYVKDADTENEMPFSELNVIDKDLDLYMRFAPSKPQGDDWVYTDAIIIDTYNNNAPIEIQDSKTLESSNISYGTNYDIDVIQEIKNDTLCKENLIGVLNWLDEPNNIKNIVWFKQLTVSNLTNNVIDKDIIIDNKLTCSYKDEEGCFNVSENDTFNYKFTSVFNLQENTILLPTIQFKVEVSGGEEGQDVNGVLKNINAYGFNSADSANPDFTEFKYKLDTSKKLIEFMYKDDPRADSDYVPITEDKIGVDNYNEDKIDIFFHSGLVNDKMYPACKKENVSIKKISLPADKNQFNSIVFESIDYNGFNLNTDWEVKEEGATNND